jgi:transcriptional regulator with XRE-family HTH domain
MAKSIMTRGQPGSEVDFSQRILTRAEFGKRLYSYMLKKGWNQSTMAREVGLGRDSISQYVRGRSIPNPINLDKLAKALNVEADVLFPNYDAQTNAVEEPTLEMKSIDNDAENMWLRINMKVDAKKALEVFKILKG